MSLDLDAIARRSEKAQNTRSGLAPANRENQDALRVLCREDVPALVARVRELEAELAEAKDLHGYLTGEK